MQEAVGRKMQWPGHHTDSKIAAHRSVASLLCYLLACTQHITRVLQLPAVPDFDLPVLDMFPESKH